MATQYLPAWPPVTAPGDDRRGMTALVASDRATDTRPDRVAAASGRPPPGVLALSIQRRGAVIELGLSGELDMATAPRLREAMAWLRFSSGPGTTIVIDTSQVDVITTAGYGALQAALLGPNGVWDPRVALIVGRAVAGLEVAISGAARRATGGAPPSD